MANPNPEIYGTTTDWINATELYTGGYTGTDELKNKIPQIRNVGNNRGDLYRYVNQNLLAYNTPIDPTICPCGQDPAVSAYGKIDVYHNKRDLNLNKIPDYENVYENENINWFFGTLWAGNSQAPFRYCMNEISDKNQRWTPEFENTDRKNNNSYITPWVFYETKSLLLRIKVIPLGSFPAEYGETNGAITLDDWKNNHSNQKIVGAFLEIMGCNGVTDNIISYTAPLQGTYDYYRCVNFSLLNAVNNGTSELTDYATFTYDRRYFVPLISRAVRGNGFQTTQYYYIFGHHNLDNTELKFYYSEYADDGYGIYPEIGYSDHNYEQIMKMAACFGVPFTPTDKFSFNILFNDNDLYLPIIDENGVTHGEYTHGNDNLTNDLYTKDSIREYDYDPTRPPTPIDPNTYSDTTNWNSVNFRQSFTKRYILNSAQVAQLSSELWAAQSSKPAELDFQNYAVDEYLTNNPIDTIVSLKYFPCTFSDVAPAVVHLGKYTTNIAATALGTSVRVIDFDPIAIWRHFGDFRDFEPYTQLSVYIPFCGVVPLKTADCMGKYVSVKLCIDTSTGAAAGFVIVSNTGSGGICVATANGTAAIDIPVSGLQSANISNAVFNAAATWAQTQINNSAGTNLLANLNSPIGTISKGFSKMFNLGSLKGAVLGGPIGAFGVLANADPTKAYAKGTEMELENTRAEYDLQHVQMPTRLIGSSAPALSSVMETAVRLIIYRPITDEKGLANYADTVGFATLQSGTVSQFSGFTVGTIDVSGINATAAEKQAIAAAFANGVYL